MKTIVRTSFHHSSNKITVKCSFTFEQKQSIRVNFKNLSKKIQMLRVVTGLGLSLEVALGMFAHISLRGIHHIAVQS